MMFYSFRLLHGQKNPGAEPGKSDPLSYWRNLLLVQPSVSLRGNATVHPRERGEHVWSRRETRSPPFQTNILHVGLQRRQLPGGYISISGNGCKISCSLRVKFGSLGCIIQAGGAGGLAHSTATGWTAGSD